MAGRRPCQSGNAQTGQHNGCTAVAIALGKLFGRAMNCSRDASDATTDAWRKALTARYEACLAELTDAGEHAAAMDGMSGRVGLRRIGRSVATTPI